MIKDVPKTWPTVHQIYAQIHASPEYQAARDLHVDDLDIEVSCFVGRYMEMIQHSWIINLSHLCLGESELYDKLKKDRNYNEEAGYLSNYDVIRLYYKILEQNVQDTLKSGCGHQLYDDESLELMIPFVKSKWFDREKIKQQYYAQHPHAVDPSRISLAAATERAEQRQSRREHTHHHDEFQYS